MHLLMKIALCFCRKYVENLEIQGSVTGQTAATKIRLNRGLLLVYLWYISLFLSFFSIFLFFSRFFLNFAAFGRKIQKKIEKKIKK